jgi:hypothetical protein
MKRSKLLILISVLILIFLCILPILNKQHIREGYVACNEQNSNSNIRDPGCKTQAEIKTVYGVGEGDKVTVNGALVDVDFNRVAADSDFTQSSDTDKNEGKGKTYKLQKADPGPGDVTGKKRCFSILNNRITPGFTSCDTNNGWPDVYVQKLGTTPGIYQLRIKDSNFNKGGGKCIINKDGVISYEMCNSNNQPNRNWKIYKHKSIPRQFKITTNTTSGPSVNKVLYFNSTAAGITGANDTKNHPIRKIELYSSSMSGTAINIP